MQPLISIITVCYNSEKTIRRTIESVLSQDYEELEYIVVDGQSTDGTLEIIKEYEPKFQGRMKWISEKDHGIYDAMNKGIRLSKGTLIGIINSDDYYEAGAVKNMANSMIDKPYQILYGYVRSERDGMECSIERQSHNILPEHMIAHPGCFVTKNIYEEFGMFDLQYKSVADYDFMLRMYHNQKVTFVPVDFLVAHFTLGGMSGTNDAWLDLLKLKANYGLIPEKEYKKQVRRNKIYTLIKGTK